MSFGKRLRDLRESHNLSQKKLAELAGLSSKAGNFSQYESDKVKPSIDVLIALCLFFNVSSDYLLFGNTEPTHKKAKVINDPDLEFTIQLLSELYTNPDPNIRGWAKIQFQKAFDSEIEKKKRAASTTTA